MLIDVSGNGFNLTNGIGGVSFDLHADGTKERISSTAAETDDAWLVLDRNGNGRVDDGSEVFDNFTPQSEVTGVEENGFVALAEFGAAIIELEYKLSKKTDRHGNQFRYRAR